MTRADARASAEAARAMQLRGISPSTQLPKISPKKRSET
jgi:hypothetical protein